MTRPEPKYKKVDSLVHGEVKEIRLISSPRHLIRGLVGLIMKRFILILLTSLFWSNVSSAEFKLPNQDYSEIKSVYSYGDKKLIVVSEETFESIWIYDPLTNKQTRVKNVWHFIDYTSSVVSYKKSEFDLKPRLAVITEDE